MSNLKIILALAAATVLGSIAATRSQAQVFVYGPPVIGPRVMVAPRVVARPYPVVTTYSTPTYVGPVVPYATYRPVVPAPVGVVATTRYRPAVVRPGIGGLPNVYVPGQPVRNALRFTLP